VTGTASGSSDGSTTGQGRTDLLITGDEPTPYEPALKEVSGID
jgi:hypothetical protein